MTITDSSVHHRRSIRLDEYDYRQGGAYFVTLCVHRHACLLGQVNDGEIRLSEAGQFVAKTWADLPSRFPTVELDAFVIMPNHIHGIIMLTDPPLSPTNSVGAGLALPKNEGNPRVAPTLGDIVGAFKSISAIGCNRLLGRSGLPFWQRNYWEHIVRNEHDLARLCEYIERNPGKWGEDEYHPAKSER